MTTNNGATAMDPRAIDRSVVEPQQGVHQTAGQVDGLLDGAISMFTIAKKADGIVPWGTAPTIRDRQLRATLPTEPFTLGAISTIVAANMGLDFQLEGPPATVERVQDVLQGANWGGGWEDWTGKMSLDFYTQDKGAFSELVRDVDEPQAPVIGLNHLDAVRCWHTGNPMVPVLYIDRLGKWHGLKYWQVITAAEMPAPHELLYGLQYCALTRVLEITRILRNILTLIEERSGGRHTRAVHIVSGIKKGDIEQAIRLANAAADMQGFMRYLEPVIVATLDPNAKPTLETLHLADLPDGFSEHIDDYFKWFMVALSTGLLRDYQDFAPLPGGGLGTSSQSMILHMKTRGKGPAIWQKTIQHRFNFFGVVPRNVTFKFDETDLEEEKQRAELFNTFASGFKTLIDARVIDPKAAQTMLVEAKLISQDLFDDLQSRELEGLPPMLDPNLRFQQDQAGGRPGAGGRGGNSVSDDNDSSRGRTELGERGMTIDVTDDRLQVEGELTDAGERALGLMSKEIRKRLEAAAR